MHCVRRFHLSQLMHAGSILVRHCGLSNIQRLGLTDDYKSGTEVSHWLHFFYGLSFLQPNDVSDAFAFDIMSCSPTSDKYEKFGDYFCSTYLETAVFPPSLWAQIPSDARRTNNGPESFHRHFSSLLPCDASAERGYEIAFVCPSVTIRYREQIGWNS